MIWNHILALTLILLVVDLGVEDRETSSRTSQERKERQSHSLPASWFFLEWPFFKKRNMRYGYSKVLTWQWIKCWKRSRLYFKERKENDLWKSLWLSWKCPPTPETSGMKVGRYLVLSFLLCSVTGDIPIIVYIKYSEIFLEWGQERWMSLGLLWRPLLWAAGRPSPRIKTLALS